MTFEELQKKVKFIRSNIETWVEEELKNLEPEIKELIQQQLGKGIKGDGSKITPSYSTNYAKKKGFKTPNLKVTGKFWESIAITSIKDSIAEIEGKLDNKGFDVAGHLEKRYTSSIYELTETNQNKIFEKININVLNRFNNELNN